MPLISVIIPLYNKEQFIATTLKSVLEQTFFDFEILIIDDGSTDKSAEIIRGFVDPRIQLISKKNEGVSAVRNLGIEKAAGKYIAFLDADDYWYPDFLQTMASLIKAYPEEYVFSSAIEVQINNTIFPAQYSIPKTKIPQIINYFEGSLNQSAIFTSGAIFENTVFKKIGNFDVALKTEEDIDLWIRIGIKYPIVFNPTIMVRYNYDPKGLSKNSGALALKTNFSHYAELEKTNPDLRKYLTIHRFSMALKCKIAGQKKGYSHFYNLIYLQDLNQKQRLLIVLPGVLLRKLLDLKLFLQRKNIHLSAFR